MSSTTSLPKPSDKPTNALERGSIPGAERIVCLNADDGKVLWRHEYDCPYTVAYPAGPRTTPVVSEGKVFSLGAEGNLFCLDAATGSVVWSRDFKAGLQNQDPDVGLRRKPAAGRQQTDLPGRRLQLDGGRFGQKHRPGNLAGVERQGAGLLFPGDLPGGRRPAIDRLASGIGQLAGSGDGQGLLVLEVVGACSRRHDDRDAAPDGRFAVSDLFLQRLVDAPAGRLQTGGRDGLAKPARETNRTPTSCTRP